MPVNVHYKIRFDAVLAYIQDNLEGDLSVEALSAVAHFRRFTSIGSSAPTWVCRLPATCN